MKSLKSLDKGLFLEDTSQCLTWETSLQKLVYLNNAKILKLGDRTKIDWGDHYILEGLQVNLTTTYLAPLLPIFLRRFRIIEHWESGDSNALNEFDRIGSHICNVFGKPSELNDKMEREGEKEWIWTNGNTKLILFLFQQHAFKLVFSIKHGKH